MEHWSSAFDFTYRLVNKTVPEHCPGHRSSIARTVTVLERSLAWCWPMSNSTPQAIPTSTFWISMDQGQVLKGKSSPATDTSRAKPAGTHGWSGNLHGVQVIPSFRGAFMVQVLLGGGRVAAPHLSVPLQDKKCVPN